MTQRLGFKAAVKEKLFL